MGILVVDDEEHDVEQLMSSLQTAVGQRMDVDYISSSADVVSAMKDYRRANGRPYRALITDFNMDDLNGKQVIQIVMGRVGSSLDDRFDLSSVSSFEEIPEPMLREHLQQNFKTVQGYRRFCRRHRRLAIVLHSSQKYGDGINDLPEDVEFVHKSPEAEQQIIEILNAKGIIKNSEMSRILRKY